MPQTLPLVPAVPHYRFSTVLAGEPYGFEIRWNTRAAAWFMNVLTEDGQLIRAGIKLVLGAVLGGREVNPEFPLGVFQAADMSGQGIEATYDDLGTRVQVFFYPFSEFQT